METDTGYPDDAHSGQGESHTHTHTHTHTHGLMKSLVCLLFMMMMMMMTGVCVPAGVVEGRAEERTTRTDRC